MDQTGGRRKAPDCRARGATIEAALVSACVGIEAYLRKLAAVERAAPEDAAPLVVSVTVSASAATPAHWRESA
jgi:hypothetical protein